MLNSHPISRRAALGGIVGGAAGILGLPGATAAHAQTATPGKAKRLLLLLQNGGLSQYESWDPKPGTIYGGPCMPIPTSVPGTHISEWMPHTAKQMHHLMLIRSMSTGENMHGEGQYLMLTGRRMGAALLYPTIDCIANKFLTPANHPVPGLVCVGAGGGSSAFLGPRYSPVVVEPGKPPANLDRPSFVTAESETRRTDLLRQLNARFQQKRGTADTSAYAYSFDQATQLMQNKKLFDLSEEPAKDVERYGKHELGQQYLMARRLFEKGVTCVTVNHNGYDTHAENFNVHIDLLEQWDRPFAALIEDLAARGMLADTLVISTGEFGRTPQINTRFGRDHWSHTWSLALAGGGFTPGAVYGATSADGAEIKDKKVESPPLFHTLCKSLGIDPRQHWTVEGEQVPIGDPAFEAIPDLL